MDAVVKAISIRMMYVSRSSGKNMAQIDEAVSTKPE